MLDMKRRSFITLLGGAAAWPLIDALLADIEACKGEKGIPTLRDIGEALFSSAAGGDVRAIALLAERLDGKVPQQLQGTDEEGEAGPLLGVVYVGSSAETDAASKADHCKKTQRALRFRRWQEPPHARSRDRRIAAAAPNAASAPRLITSHYTHGLTSRC